MISKKANEIKDVLKKYNYWRKSLNLSSNQKIKVAIDGRVCEASSCVCACHSDPCSAIPTCDFD